MTKEKKIVLANNKVIRLTEILRSVELDGDEKLYNEVENQLNQAINKLERLQEDDK